MKKRDQTSFHDPPDELGNCFRACVASLLEVKVDELPRFEKWMFENPKAWERIFSSWLDNSRFSLELRWSSNPLSCHTIAFGPSPRSDDNHCVVSKDGDIVHDPHPSRDGLDGEPLFYGRFVKV